ncbi:MULTISPECIES: hypothetical protein [unclassified Sphingomonas]|jgi:hypothetical protein|uniref:hypothetical protein n=1 Tax=unclassified Sphingomonas TaxID=196159 RepID=UPI0025EED181|nr:MULTISPECIES: hypothetical protein [unclassified Sphingomonas]
MSVDIYVAIPAARWPDIAAVQRCVTSHAYPLHIKRFPVLDRERVVNDGVTATIDGKDAYLEGALARAPALPNDVRMINDRLAASQVADRIGSDHVLMSFHLRAPVEMRAAGYVIAALIVCFDGLGFEPQGNTSGHAAFAESFVAGSDALKGL